jgi:hypothetical protein
MAQGLGAGAGPERLPLRDFHDHGDVEYHRSSSARIEAMSMLLEYLWYALVGLLLVLAFAGALVLNIRYERARKRAEARMTPEERKERDVRANAAKSWW